MNKKDIINLFGFTLFILGFLSLMFSFIGIQFSFLTFLDAMGYLTGFILRLLMVLGGIVLLFLNNTNWKEE